MALPIRNRTINGFTTLPPGPLPDDADTRLNWLRQNLPEYAAQASSIDVVEAPGPSAQAVLAATGAGPYDMTALADLVLVNEDYVGRNDAPGRVGRTQSGSSPATATAAANSSVGVSIAGVAAADVVVGTQTTAEGIRAALEAGIIAAAPALPSRQRQAYLGAKVTYSPPRLEKTLATALPAGTEVFRLKLAEGTRGLRQGDSFILRDIGAVQPDVERTVLHIFHGTDEIAVERFTPAGAGYGAGSGVFTDDAYYAVETGKKGLDQTVVFSAPAAGTDVSATLKLKAADGAAEVAGLDQVGRQTFRFVTADFTTDSAATAQEVANVLNRTLTGAEATAPGGVLTITTDKFGESANLLAEAGVSQAALLLPTTLAEGTNDDMQLSLDSPEVLLILEVDVAGGGSTGVFRPLTAVRVENSKLVNVDGTDYSADVQWLVVSKPSR